MKLYGVKLCYDSDLSYDLGLKDTYEDYQLALAEDDFSISEPEARTEYKTIRGMDGSIDVSEAPQGYPVYENRTIKFKLFKTPTPFMAYNVAEVMTLRQTFMHAYQGRMLRIIFPDDETHYWLGRLSIGPFEFGKWTFECTAIVFPYKLKISETQHTYANLTSAAQTFYMTNEQRYVIPEITVYQNTIVQMLQGVSSIPSAVTIELPSGESSVTVKLPETLLISGTVRMSARTVSASSGSITITYREGAL